MVYQRLLSLMEGGEIRAGLYLLELYLAEKSREPAIGLLNQINSEFSDEQLEESSTALELYRNKIDAL